MNVVQPERPRSRRLRPHALVCVLAALVLVVTACGSGKEPSTSAYQPVDDSASAAPLAFSGTTLTGSELDAMSLSGQPVVLWFWAPWCTVCRAEAPDVATIADEFDGEVTFLGVPGLGEVKDMQAFVQETGIAGFEHVIDDDGQLWQRFGVAAQPAFVFIDRDGTAELHAGGLDAAELRRVTDDLASG